MQTIKSILYTSSLTLTLVGGQAYAQQAPGGASPAAAPQAGTASEEPGDILVTAQRRSERLQDVPITVAHVSGTALEAAGISDLSHISLAVPGANVRSSSGFMNAYIRGVGSSAKTPLNEAPIATYVDDVYIASLNSALSFNNIESIEVLKGPQGTLFGRNATGGLFNIKTVDPSFAPTGKFHIGYGNYQTISGDGYLSTGLSKTIAMDIAFIGSHMGEGYGKVLLTGRDVYKVDRNIGVRSKVLFKPDDATRAVLILDYASQLHSMGIGNSYKPGTNLVAAQPASATTAAVPAVPVPIVSTNPYDTNDNVQPLVQSESGGASFNISHDFGPHFRLKSITAYRFTKFRVDLDADGTPVPNFAVFLNLKDRQFTQELQAQSIGTGPLTWTAGLFYFWARSVRDPTEVLKFAGGKALYDEAFRAQSIAGYAQGTYALTPDTHLTLGARYTYERRTISGSQSTVLDSGFVIPGANTPLRTSVQKPTFRVSLDHKLTPDILLYASFNTGFKSGGFSFLNAPIFRPETIKSYEVGFKSQLLDHRVTFNVAGFYNDYRDIQVQLITTRGSQVLNGAGAEIYGLDADLSAKITPNLSLNAGLELLHAKYTDFAGAPIGVPGGGLPATPGSAAGKFLPFAPPYTANVTLVHRIPLAGGTLTTTALAYISGHYYAQPDNFEVQSAYTVVNGSVQWESAAGYSVKIWANNITDHLVMTTGYLSNLGPQIVVYDAPRTYGVTLGYKF